ncbi:hypothetical protein KSP40_PGU018728 [Platanthera guangdongensis]|uniref:Uncharacterized protein n=1 Tax=Platanthera guangdongensis TaxID=2320717 RepID=A0ABR2MJ69_9ASPA
MIPINLDDQRVEDNKVSSEGDRSDSKEKLFYHAKKVMQSDATNSFSIQKYCVDYIFPKLDYTATTPVQILPVNDIHGKIWNF